MYFNNAKMQAFTNITTIKDESVRDHPNMTNTIQAQNTRELLVLLVQMHGHKKLEVSKAQGVFNNNSMELLLQQFANTI
jgi:hypothetical protein